MSLRILKLVLPISFQEYNLTCYALNFCTKDDCYTMALFVNLWNLKKCTVVPLVRRMPEVVNLAGN